VQTRSVDDDATGVGDLLLRTKYHFLSLNGFNLASGLSLRLPTGDEDDFQGLGDVVVTPYLTVSQEYGRFDFHLQVGVDINADDTERSRVRYGGGMAVQLIERVAFLLDIIGSSNITDQDISVTVPVIIGSQEVGTQTITQKLRTDIVDLSVGFKAALAQSAVGFAGVFIPLNDDGLRADVVPTAGLEVSF
jgi:Putative MetA-pathway of phenol degradation